jgi:hypothetical protein
MGGNREWRRQAISRLTRTPHPSLPLLDRTKMPGRPGQGEPASERTSLAAAQHSQRRRRHIAAIIHKSTAWTNRTLAQSSGRLGTKLRLSAVALGCRHILRIKAGSAVAAAAAAVTMGRGGCTLRWIARWAYTMPTAARMGQAQALPPRWWRIAPAAPPSAIARCCGGLAPRRAGSPEYVRERRRAQGSREGAVRYLTRVCLAVGLGPADDALSRTFPGQ